MGAYRLLIKPSAGKELARLGTKAGRQRIVRRIGVLRMIPGRGASKSWPATTTGIEFDKATSGSFTPSTNDDKEVTVFKLGDRKDVYR